MRVAARRGRRNGHTETVAELIRHGADLTVTNNEGNTFSFV